MPTKPLERLIFAQGGLCFFCDEPLPIGEASVEHLVASAKGGDSNLENCVACCKTVNTLLGSMSLKQKFQVVLNQRGEFKCPARKAKVPAPKTSVKLPTVAQAKSERLKLVVDKLRERGDLRPKKLTSLRNFIATQFGNKLTDKELDALLNGLQSAGTIAIDGTKLTYDL
ncbi:MAG: HNH endonuclease [Burkholderiales bacterium]|nr:HNH endonuclease [Burkholderiales bacterium]MDP2399498.1 HNH endonuclease [Burkholderiales bacterium]MDP3714949.1 HNH endonuclease [Burkholderiales bacterium]